jgi:hypothetical protein
LLVLSAKAKALVDYTGFAIVLFSGVAVVALFVLRRREPRATGPLRTWGYLVTRGAGYVGAKLNWHADSDQRPRQQAAAGRRRLSRDGAVILIYWWFSRRR